MTEPMISVVLLTDGARRHSALRALQSLLAQTYENMQILVAAQGWADYRAAEGLAENFAGDGRIRFLFQPLAQNGQSLRNWTLRETGGEYIVFMSCSEIWHPEKLARQLALFAEGASAVYCDGIRHLGQENETFFAAGAGLENWAAAKPIKTPGQILYKKAALLQAGGFDESLTELGDIDMLLRLRRTGAVVGCEDSLMECDASTGCGQKRREFNEQERFLRREDCISAIVTSKSFCYGFYSSLVRLAREARMPIEAVQYVGILFLRAPLLTLLEGGKAVLRQWSAARRVSAGRLACGKYLSRVRRCLRKGGEEYPRFGDAAGEHRLAGAAGECRPADAAGEHRLAGAAEECRPAGAAGEQRLAGAAGECRLVNAAGYAQKSYALTGSRHDGELVIPDGTLQIAEGAFAGCSGITRVRVPGSVSRIGANAFAGCESLEEVVFPADGRLTDIGDFAFAGCRKLVKVLLPARVSSIGRGAFLGCVSLREAVFFSPLAAGGVSSAFSDNMERIAPECFAGCRSLKAVSFHGGSRLREIGEYGFWGCAGLERIRIDSPLRVIGPHAFEGCIGLLDAAVSQIDGVEQLGSYAFCGCARLTWFTLPTALTEVPEHAFDGCVSLKSMTIPWSVKRVQRGAFIGCRSLEGCTVQNPITHIHAKAFEKHTEITQKRYRDIEGK